MNSSIKILIKEEVSEDLALRDSARKFFNKIEALPTKEVVVDFKNVRSISRSFAHEYLSQKQKLEKVIVEINIPPNVQKMFKVVEEPKERVEILSLKSIKAVSI